MTAKIQEYGIRDIINYRSLDWVESDDFLYLTDIPSKFEPYFVNPNYYCVGMITSGSLRIIIDSKAYALSTHSLMIYRPGQTFQVTQLSRKTKGTFILFTKKFLEHLNENIFSVKHESFLSENMQNMIDLTAPDKQRISRLFKGVFELLIHLSPHSWELVARSLTSVMLYEIDNILKGYLFKKDQITNADLHFLDTFNNLVAKHFTTNRETSFYAKKLGITPRSLYLRVKKALGDKPSALIYHRLVSEAKYMVSYTNKTFSEIAYLLNFSDPFAFSKFFKNQTGFSPKNYRSRYFQKNS